MCIYIYYSYINIYIYSYMKFFLARMIKTNSKQS